MINKIISWSIHNRIIVLIIALGLAAYGAYSLSQTPIDAIPDLSDKQVIIFTQWTGKNPQLIEDQITFPLVSNLQGIPKIKDIRASSMFGMSFIHVIFEDKVDLYWARTRVLERLNYAQKLLPSGVTPNLGPDASGVGQVYWYTLDSKELDLGELRTLQDWYVKFALQSVNGVSEVASFGGFQKQYQLDLNPHKLNYYNISLMDVIQAVKSNNNDAGGGAFSISSDKNIIRGEGYLKSKKELANIAIKTNGSIPVYVKDVGKVKIGGNNERFGILDDNGNGEVVGGVILMRYGQNAVAVIDGVKKKIKQLQKGLPGDVTFRTAYDRSKLIKESVRSVSYTIIEEIILVCLVILLFIFHFRSSLVVMLIIPVAILFSFILIRFFGFTSNIMSLSGIAIAVGVIVDNGIVMVENAHRHLTKE